jgi:large subunit ribosomal protein L32e
MERKYKMVKFLRRDSARHSQFGRRRKKMLKWRRPTGRDNKMREKRRGYPPRVSIGYKNKKNNKKIILIRSIADIEKLQKGELGILGKIGKKKKIEIIKKANDKKIKFTNVNIKKFLKILEKGERKHELK